MPASRLPLVAHGVDVDRRRRRSARPGPATPRRASARRSRRPGCRPATSTAGSGAGSPPGSRRRRRPCSRAPGSGSRPSTSPSARSRPTGPCTPTRGSAPRRRSRRAGGAPRETASRSRWRSRAARSACRPPGTAARRIRRGRAGWRAPRRESTGSPCGTCRGCPPAPMRQVVLNTTPGHLRIRFEHRSRSGCRRRARVAFACSRSVCSLGIATASLSSSSSTVAIDGRRMRELGKDDEPHRQEGRAARRPPSRSSASDAIGVRPHLSRDRSGWAGRSGRRRRRSGWASWSSGGPGGDRPGLDATRPTSRAADRRRHLGPTTRVL